MVFSQAMKQGSLDLTLSTRKTRKDELLAQMDRVVPWAAWIELIAPYYPESKNGRPPFACGRTQTPCAISARGADQLQALAI